jgi:hypothetical protein
MELIVSILCDNNDNYISYENDTKLYVLIKIFLLCKRSELTSCNIPYEGVPLAPLLEAIVLDILLSDLAKSSSTLKAAFWVVGVPQMCVENLFPAGFLLLLLRRWGNSRSLEHGWRRCLELVVIVVTIIIDIDYIFIFPACSKSNIPKYQVFRLVTVN